MFFQNYLRLCNSKNILQQPLKWELQKQLFLAGNQAANQILQLCKKSLTILAFRSKP